ncbi:MAG: hypothetical protein LC672_02465 [Acidobacteria bacterium]|nr:hypothetical protein [Acidobacteriota bacterium]
MSYHILHQFDEQWLAELTRDSGGNKSGSILDSTEGVGRWGRRRRLASRESRRWTVVGASIMLAAFALLFALDANRRADALQERLDSIETTMKVNSAGPR